MRKLYNRPLAMASGTVTGDAFDLANLETVEIFTRSGSAEGGSAVVTAVANLDVADGQGNWVSAGGGTMPTLGTNSSGAKAFARASNAGAVTPSPLGAQGRVRVVLAGGSMELGINVLGF
jgi:hypothetical protein